MDDYEKRTLRAYRGELVGEHLYRRLSENCSNPAHARKLEMISRVEGRTSGVLQAIASRLGGTVSPAEIEAASQRRVSQLERLTWADFIEKALVDWPPYIAELKGLERLAPALDLTRLCINEHSRVKSKHFRAAELRSILEQWFGRSISYRELRLVFRKLCALKLARSYVMHQGRVSAVDFAGHLTSTLSLRATSKGRKYLAGNVRYVA